MKRKARFFIGLLAAALTFGTLMATMGAKKFMCNGYCFNSQCANNNVVNIGTENDDGHSGNVKSIEP